MLIHLIHVFKHNKHTVAVLSGCRVGVGCDTDHLDHLGDLQ